MTRAVQTSLPLTVVDPAGGVAGCSAAAASSAAADDDWRLDERTRETGRRGLAEARAALAAAARRAAERETGARRDAA